MKKFMSVVLSLIMAVSVMAMATIPAMAANSPQSTTHNRVIKGEVNGSTSPDVIYSPDANDPSKIDITYTGEGDVDGWEFPGLTPGVDYDILSEDGNTITIILYNDTVDVIANALVSGLGEQDTKPNKQDNGSTSPNTGAMTAAGIAVAGAGVAILAALKKNEDAE